MADDKKTVAPKKKVAHNITEVNQATGSKEELLQTTKKNATPYRIGAFVFWALAIAAEVFAILFFARKVNWALVQEGTWYYVSWIAALVLDLIFLIVGSQLWKKANHTDPASKKNKGLFWLQNNLGVIVAAVAFIPFIVLALLNKNADKKSKIIATVAAVIALAIGGLASYDWNPVSQEEMLENAGVDTVYWTDGGSVFHSTPDCQHLNHSYELKSGTSTAAIENGKTRLCKTCESRIEQEAADELDEQKNLITDLDDKQTEQAAD